MIRKLHTFTYLKSGQVMYIEKSVVIAAGSWNVK